MRNPDTTRYKARDSGERLRKKKSLFVARGKGEPLEHRMTEYSGKKGRKKTERVSGPKNSIFTR